VREQTDARARRRAEQDVLARLAALGLPRTRRPLPTVSLLPRLRIASPCSESWEAMRGDERVRHCSRCERDVFDLSAMTRAEAETLLRGHHALPEGGLPCVRLYRRSDGTVLTADCPVGAPRKHAVQAAAVGAVMAAVVASAGSGPSAAPLPHHRGGPCPPGPVVEGSVHLEPGWGTGPQRLGDGSFGMGFPSSDFDYALARRGDPPERLGAFAETPWVPDRVDPDPEPPPQPQRP